MNSWLRIGLAVTMALFAAFSLPVVSAEPAATLATGWRGNGTGLWPDATPVLTWGRAPKGPLTEARYAVQPPAANPDTAALLQKGLLRDWLVAGPFAVSDSLQEIDRDLLGREAAIRPTPGAVTAGKTWTKLSAPPDDLTVFGAAELPWLDLTDVMPFRPNQVAYAHTYVHSPSGGRARVIVDHSYGLKAWFNGRELYRSPERKAVLGYYTQLSRFELDYVEPPSPRFDVELKAGWNSLLLKLTTSNKDDVKEMKATLRLVDLPDVAYESKNLRWIAPLPGRSTSTPILVGNRLFVMAEPDELLCLDKDSGKRLWSQQINYYEALTPDERAANPAYAAKVEPLVAKLRSSTARAERMALRAQIQKELLAIDPARFKLAGDGHFEAHFGIVGFTMPTPVSDGTNVYVWSGMGVAAAFDLEGKRRWITRIRTDHLSYGSSPAMADGVLAVFLEGLYGLDAKTGALLWTQPNVRHNIGAILPARLHGENVFVTQRGNVISPKDGRILYRMRGSEAANDMGWAPPVLLGERMYLPKYGVTQLNLFDFPADNPKGWEGVPSGSFEIPPEAQNLPNGRRVDRWSAGSPVIWQDIAYQVDIYQVLYATDLKTGKLLYRKELDLEGFTHYNAVAVAASPTLIGKHLFVCDNQGTTLVIEPSPEYRQVARNCIGTVLDRAWPVPPQETLAYAPPITDGKRIYLRGEANLYCTEAR